jgi:hypothetical protein
MEFKRTNKTAMEVILVADGSVDALASGALTNATNSLGIANHQLGVLSWDPSGSETTGNFITAGRTQAQVRAIKVLQGTPNSSQINYASFYEENDRAYVDSAVIRAGKIKSLFAKLPHPGRVAATLLSGFAATPEDLTEYGMLFSTASVRDDVYYGDAGNAVEVDLITPDYTTLSTPGPLDHLLQTLAWKANRYSKWTASVNTTFRAGNRNFFVLALNTAGSTTGATLGDISCTSSLTVMRDTNTYGGSTFSSDTVITPDNSLIIALANLVNDSSAISASSTLEMIDLVSAGTGQQATGTFTVTDNGDIATDTVTIGTTLLVEGTDFDAGSDDTAPQLAVTAVNLAAAIDAVSGVSATSSAAVVTVVNDAFGTVGNSTVWTYTDQGSAGGTISGAGTLTGGSATNVDALVVVSIPHTPSAYFDNVPALMADATVDVTGYFQTASTPTMLKILPVESIGSGRKWTIINDNRARLNVHTMQNAPNAEFFSQGPTYINAALDYVSYSLDFYDQEDTLTGYEYNPKRLHILTPGVINCLTITNSVADLVAGGLGYTVTYDTTMTGNWDASLSVWLEAASTYFTFAANTYSDSVEFQLT